MARGAELLQAGSHPHLLQHSPRRPPACPWCVVWDPTTIPQPPHSPGTHGQTPLGRMGPAAAAPTPVSCPRTSTGTWCTAWPQRPYELLEVFNEENGIKSSVCPKCPSLREAAAAQPGPTRGAGAGGGCRGGLWGPGAAPQEEEEEEVGETFFFIAFSIIFLPLPKFTAHLGGVSASNLIKSGKL